MLGLASVLAACSNSPASVADGGNAHAEDGNSIADVGGAHADGGNAHADGGNAVADAHPDGSSAVTDGGDAHRDGWGPGFPGATCADTFDTQTASRPPLPLTNPDVASGACGGYLVWLNTGMLYSLICIYDPTTKTFVGGHYADDTSDTSTGAGPNLPKVCEMKESYPAPDAGH